MSRLSLIPSPADNISEQDFLFHHPPTPPPYGEPLLTTDDSRTLSDFFANIMSDQFPNSFGEGFNQGDYHLISSQLPPNYLGHTTSFGQQPAGTAASIMNGMPSGTFPETFDFERVILPPAPQPPTIQPPTIQPPTIQPPPMHFQQPRPRLAPNAHMAPESSAHADIAAVLTTLHNGHSGGGQQNSHPRQNNFNNEHMMPHNMRNSILQSRPMQHAHAGPERNEVSRIGMGSHDDSGMLFNDMMFGRRVPNNQRTLHTPELQWGSDATFSGNQAYVPPEHESSEVLERRRMAPMKALGINNSATTTRAPSPVGPSNIPPNGVRDHSVVGHGHTNGVTAPVTTPKKRRKSKPKSESEIVQGSSTVPPQKSTARKRKSKEGLNGSTEANASAQSTTSKRRKSKSTANGKTPRENLSDEQKRENHIKSEQRRRGCIKDGFDEMSEIVPNLKGGGYSKSTMLGIAGEWLENLLKGNEELARLARR
ncbi:hypothetical protein F4780DRAFT_370831 [Xylariomycetidae sp. FL0641]|nr:hypothetical protein F4780DRAFT_370831 [Xylariomycetidae sp. FL0641]